MSPARMATASAVALLALLAAPANAAEVSPCAAETYRPAEQSPFGGFAPPPLEPVTGLATTPDGFRLTAGEAATIAAGTDVVREEVAEDGEVVPRAYAQGPCRWQVSFFRDGEEAARVAIDDRTGTVLEAWRDHQVGAELARGYEGAVAQAVNSPWVWIPLCVALPRAVFRPPPPLPARSTSTCS